MIGHIKIDRKIQDWEWYKDSNMLHVFLHLLINANYKEGKFQGNLVKRGQLITGRLKLAADTGLSEMQIRTCLNKLKSTNEITIKVTSKFSLITVCKYDYYQSAKNYDNQQDIQQLIQPITSDQPASNQQVTTNNNSNNDNKDKNVFINMAIAENFNGLPDIKIGATIELLKITKQVDVTSEEVNGLWNVFKKQNLNGKKYYHNIDEVYSHFINWSKTQKIERNVTSKTSFGGTGRSIKFDKA